MSFNQSNNDICSHVVVKLISVAVKLFSVAGKHISVAVKHISVAVKLISVAGKHISVAVKHISLHNNSFFPSNKNLICIKINKSAFIYA